MKLHFSILILVISFVGLPSFAQQNVTIGPDDDVVGIIQTVVDFGSTITFEAGYYKVTPKADGTGRPDLLRVPAGTTVRGAGSGMDPANATIIDCGFAFDSAVKIDDGIDGVVVEDITFINVIDAVLEFDTGSFENTFNNVWALKSHDNCVDMNGNSEAVFNFCVFGWSAADAVNLGDQSLGIFTNCDIFLGSSDVVEVAAEAEGAFRNCIFYAGPASNDIEANGFTTIANCVGWDPYDADEPGVSITALGRLDLNGGGAGLPIDSVGEDPMYVASPGMGFKAETMDLHLQEGSPALTAGNTEFNEFSEPIGEPTFAGSHGPAGQV